MQSHFGAASPRPSSGFRLDLNMKSEGRSQKRVDESGPEKEDEQAATPQVSSAAPSPRGRRMHGDLTVHGRAIRLSSRSPSPSSVILPPKPLQVATSVLARASSRRAPSSQLPDDAPLVSGVMEEDVPMGEDAGGKDVLRLLAGQEARLAQAEKTLETFISELAKRDREKERRRRIKDVRKIEKASAARQKLKMREERLVGHICDIDNKVQRLKQEKEEMSQMVTPLAQQMQDVAHKIQNKEGLLHELAQEMQLLSKRLGHLALKMELLEKNMQLLAQEREGQTWKMELLAQEKSEMAQEEAALGSNY